MNIVPLVYHVDCDKKYGRYIASIHPRAFKRLALPSVIKDEFNSLSATYPWAYACQCKGNVNNIHMENYFFLEFQRIFRKYWDYAYGVPFLRFIGKTSTFSTWFCNQNIFLLTLTYGVDSLYQYTYWEEAWMKYREPATLVSISLKNPRDSFREVHLDVTSITDRLAGKRYLRKEMLSILNDEQLLAEMLD